MTDVVWGTGYGGKRHVAPDALFVDGRGRTRPERALCSDTIWLHQFARGDDAPEVMSKPPCSRCSKKAGVVTCPTCNGAGTVASEDQSNPDQLELLTENEVRHG